MEIPFSGKLDPKYQNCQFKSKCETYTNPNMQNSMVMFNFFGLDLKYLFLAKNSKLLAQSEIWYLD